MDLPCIIENYKTLDKKALTKQEISVRYWMRVCLCVCMHTCTYTVRIQYVSLCIQYILLDKCVLSSVFTFVRPYVFSLTCEMLYS